MTAPKSKTLPKTLHLDNGAILKLKWERFKSETYSDGHVDAHTILSPVYLWQGCGLEIAVQRSEATVAKTWTGSVYLLADRVEVLRTREFRDHLNAARSLDAKLRKLEAGLAKFRGGK